MAEEMKNHCCDENCHHEEEDAIIINLEDEDGNEVEFEYLDTIEYDGEEFIFLIPMDDSEDEGGVVILKIVSLDDETESFEGIEDQELLDTVFEIFKDKWKDQIDFE